MKQLLIIFSLLAVAGAANAQTVASIKNSKEGSDNNYHTALYKDANEFAGTEMSLSEGKITFSGLPELVKSTWVVITNGTGEIMKQKKVSPENNIVDIHDLHGGRLYFVTITYKDKSKKAFTLNL